MKRRAQGGFTLLEVLVALAMVAIAAAGVMALTGDLFRRMGEAKDRDNLLLLAQDVSYRYGRNLVPPVSLNGKCDAPREDCQWSITSDSAGDVGRTMLRIKVDCGGGREVTLERMLLSKAKP